MEEPFGSSYFAGDYMVKNKEVKNQDNFLLYIPVKKHLEYEAKNGYVYLIFHHDKAIEKFLRRLVKKPAVSDIKLDDLGTFVWQSIDGKKNVYEIGKDLKKKFGNRCEPVYDRLIMYLRYLSKKGWIAFEKGDQ